MVEEMRAEVHYLRDRLHQELERRSDEAERYQQIIAALTAANASLGERLGELESPRGRPPEAPEAPEDAETVEEAEEELGAERARREAAETTLHEGMSEERRRREEAERERDDLREQLYARSRQQVTHQGRGQPRSDAGGAQEGARRPWWRRWLRG
jgi:DNA repair exonuclease SbcCD ATPase subunit